MPVTEKIFNNIMSGTKDSNIRFLELRKILNVLGFKVKDKERYLLYMEVVERAENLGYKGDRMSLLMDIESADNTFNLRMEDWLNADNFNFMHDIYGIVNNIVRDRFPSENFGYFLPRFSGRN